MPGVMMEEGRDCREGEGLANHFFPVAGVGACAVWCRVK